MVKLAEGSKGKDSDNDNYVVEDANKVKGRDKEHEEEEEEEEATLEIGYEECAALIEFLSRKRERLLSTDHMCVRHFSIVLMTVIQFACLLLQTIAILTCPYLE